jgi:hypothetical protein
LGDNHGLDALRCSFYVLIMDDERPGPTRIPVGFNEVSYAAVRRAVLIARQRGLDEARAAREIDWGMHPALPVPMIHDAAKQALWGALPAARAT